MGQFSGITKKIWREDYSVIPELMKKKYRASNGVFFNGEEYIFEGTPMRHLLVSGPTLLHANTSSNEKTSFTGSYDDEACCQPAAGATGIIASVRNTDFFAAIIFPGPIIGIIIGLVIFGLEIAKVIIR
jgi:hypothetical protein